MLTPAAEALLQITDFDAHGPPARFIPPEPKIGKLRGSVSLSFSPPWRRACPAAKAPALP
jgi:hypothetical protein